MFHQIARACIRSLIRAGWLPDATLQKLRVDRCKVGWLLADCVEWDTWLWIACRGTGDSTGGRAHRPRTSLETGSQGSVLVHGRVGRMICTMTWPRSGDKVARSRGRVENNLHGCLAEFRSLGEGDNVVVIARLIRTMAWLSCASLDHTLLASLVCLLDFGNVTRHLFKLHLCVVVKQRLCVHDGSRYTS